MTAHDNQVAIEAEARAWLIKLFNDSPDEQLKAEFSHWLNRSDKHRQAFIRSEKLWRQLGLLDNLAELSDMLPPQPIQRSKPSINVSAWLGMAAAAILLVTGINWQHKTLPVSQQVVQQFQTPEHTNTAITLSDGSRLVSAGQARFSFERKDNERYLAMQSGTLYFDIAHDVAHPFVISSAGSRIQVVGTEFEISLQDDQMRLSVHEGLVQLSALDTSRAEQVVMLAAGQQQLANSEGRLLGEVRQFDSKSTLAWLQGRLSYDGTPLAQVMAEINRYRTTPIEIEDPELAVLQITTSCRLDQIEQMLSGLLLAHDLRLVQQSGRTLIQQSE
ncbi:FecR family protein [Bowmanella yangjiangensis]|uniref:FecR domain-containing protein n=1 Tax=Bowmanella yangjiangensis TaxID=2811230 RepID=A0ABS3CTV1_9ALTE|nr:FecR domain-containing protein [Bowmanella yangjiangensis]MBN7819851.1 FecR domain-containing protein [Bowmanella yangjiangensis]